MRHHFGRHLEPKPSRRLQLFGAVAGASLPLTPPPWGKYYGLNQVSAKKSKNIAWILKRKKAIFSVMGAIYFSIELLGFYISYLFLIDLKNLSYARGALLSLLFFIFFLRYLMSSLFRG